MLRYALSAWLLVCETLPAQPTAQPAAWPQWGGQTRDFHVPGVQLSEKWPAAGPPKIWERPLGGGHSQLAAAGSALYTMYRNGSSEVVVALDAATGKTLWEHAYQAPFRSDAPEHGSGPYATPLIVGGRVFTTGATGKLHCLDQATGRVLWQKDLWGAEGGNHLVYGYASSPLAYRDLVIVPIGGSGKAFAAFRQNDGSVVWKRGDAVNSYSSPLVINVGGLDQLVCVMRARVVSFNPLNGDLQWARPHPAEFGINIATPVWVPQPDGSGILVVSSAYNAGTRAFRLKRDGPRVAVEDLWHSQKFYVRQTDLLHVGGVLYGANGGAATFHAADLLSGAMLWQQRMLPRGNSLFAGGLLVILDEDGQLTLARPGAKGLQILSQAQVLSGESWTPPSLAGTRLYVRNGTTAAALELGAVKTK